MQKFDIIISGGGFAGLSLAAGLKQSGLSLAIIEPQPIEKILEDASDRRTTAISYVSRKYYENIGLWHELAKQAGPINDIKIFDADYLKGDSFLDLGFSSFDVEKEIGSLEPMGHIIENHYLKKCLLKECLGSNNIRIFDKQKIVSLEQSASAANVTLVNDDILVAKLIIGADGRNSPMRNMISISAEDKTYNQSAITFNIKHEKSHGRTAIERFMPTGPFAVLPMSDLNQSSIVWTVSENTATYYMKMGDAEFNLEVQKRLKYNLGEFELISPASAYPVSLRYVKKYYQGRVALVADAAHSIHPLAGQGFNQGVKDIALLAKLIKENITLGFGITENGLLQKYEKARLEDNMQMIAATDFFNLLFSNDNKLVTHARRVGISAVDKLKPVKRFFIKRAMGA